LGAQTQEPGFIVIPKNLEDQVSIGYENGTTLIDIQSPTGIGSASFELDSGEMPERMILRLHLKGLEQFRLKSARDQIAASIPSGGAFQDESQTILSSGTETPLLPGNPLWMEVEFVSSQAEKNAPLPEGYFAVGVPDTFLRNAGTTFEVEWIDFYR
jgi:hypothetical protein